MRSRNLFTGKIEELPDKIVPGHSPYKWFKKQFHYRKATLKDDGKLCGNCKYFRRKIWAYKTFFKCLRMGVSSGEATDIRKSYICDQHKMEEK